MKYLSEKDVLAGLMFALIGIAGLGIAADFDFGSTARPGPGFFPIVLSLVLTLIGLSISALGVLRTAGPIHPIIWRPFFLVTLAVVVFALSIDRFGMMPSVFISAMIASFAAPAYGTAPRIAVSAGLAIASAVLFIGALRLPIPAWAF